MKYLRQFSLEKNLSMCYIERELLEGESIMNLLLKLFVKDRENITSPKSRAEVGRLSGLVGIVCNLILFAGKIIIGTISGALSITADAMNNLSDASSSIVTLVGFKLAEKPADDDHPYGHARFEYLSGLAIAGMIVLIGYELLKTSIDKIRHPQSINFSVALVIVLVLSIAVKFWLAAFNGKLGKMIDSATLLATASDSRNDVISTGVVLLAAIIEAVSGWRVDGFMGLAVAVFILYSGISLAKETISPLLGEAASPELQKLIVEIVESSPMVLGYHDLMVHDYGPGQRFASLHVEMNKEEDPLVCHEIIDDLERECLEKHNVHLVIHYDPVVIGDEELEHMRTKVQQILTDYDNRLSLHDFRLVPGNGHTNLVFDVAIPYDVYNKKKEIKAYLDEELAKRKEGKYYTVITFDATTFNESK